MKIRYLIVTALAALLLGGCATYGYRGGTSGDYYYGRSSGSGYYGAPYGSVGYGSYGGLYGGVGYGRARGYSRHGYWPHSYYGSRYPYYGYGPYYGRPIIVQPRPDHDRPRDNRPNAPWRNLRGVTRVEHRERPERVDVSPSGMRSQGQRERIQTTIPTNRQDVQRSRTSPWRAGSRSNERARSSPAPVRQSAPPQRAQPAARPAPRPATTRPQPRDRDRVRTQER